MNTFRSSRLRVAAPIALPAGFAVLMLTGAVAAGTGGAVGPLWVLTLAALIVAAGSFLAEPRAGLLLAVIGWLTVSGFSAAPYAQVRLAGPVAGRGAVVLACCCAAGIGAGALARRLAASCTLRLADIPDSCWPAEPATAEVLTEDWAAVSAAPVAVATRA